MTQVQIWYREDFGTIPRNHCISRLEDTPQFWIWFFYSGYIGPSVETARAFYSFYSRPKHHPGFESFKFEYIFYLWWKRNRKNNGL